MAIFSRFLAKWRYHIVSPYIAGKVLDIGCGNAAVNLLFKDSIESYYGIDCNRQNIDSLKDQTGNSNFFCRDLDIDLIAIDEKFDVILMVAVIEHIWNQRFLMEQLINMLKLSGRIVITSPSPFGNDIVHSFGSMIGLFARTAVVDHVVIYNKRRFLNLAEHFELKLIKYKRFQFFCNQLVVFQKND